MATKQNDFVTPSGQCFWGIVHCVIVVLVPPCGFLFGDDLTFEEYQIILCFNAHNRRTSH